MASWRERGAWLAALCALALSGCDDDPAAEADAGGCACPERQCAADVCALEVRIAPGCGALWGEAKVYVGDVSSEAEPAGTAREGGAFLSCEGFAAPQGDTPGEVIPFQVVSADERLVLPNPGFELRCAGAQPAVFTVDCR
jgi:hypothetical protein